MNVTTSPRRDVDSTELNTSKKMASIESRTTPLSSHDTETRHRGCAEASEAYDTDDSATYN